MSMRLCETGMYGVNSCGHHRHLPPIVTCVWERACTLWFVLVWTKNNCGSTKAQRSRTIVAVTAFVCGGEETGNEIMQRALGVCAKGLSESRAKPRGEYQLLISQPRWAYGDEESVHSVLCIKAKWNPRIHEGKNNVTTHSAPNIYCTQPTTTSVKDLWQRLFGNILWSRVSGYVVLLLFKL